MGAGGGMKGRERGIFRGLGRWMRYYLLRLVRVRDEQRRVQKGIALGAVMHFIPTPGIGLAVALIIAVFLRANKAATTIANVFAAPAAVPMWFLNYWVGKLFVGAKNAGHVVDVHGQGFVAMWHWLASQGVGFFIGIGVNMVVGFAILYVVSGWVLRRAAAKIQSRRASPSPEGRP